VPRALVYLRSVCVRAFDMIHACLALVSFPFREVCVRFFFFAL
jgi:hypothetical protein